MSDENKGEENSTAVTFSDAERVVGKTSGDGESKEESPRKRSQDAHRLRHIFRRPLGNEPKHPIVSSSFARHIAEKTFGPKKPKWFKRPQKTEINLFKEMVNYVEIGRQGVFDFDLFMETLGDLLPGVTRAEVVEIFDSMEKDEFDELDFGKFLFLLACKEQQPRAESEDDVDETLSASVVTQRQRVILSAMAYYISITTHEDIERYYKSNTRRKATVLHYHMDAKRLTGLTEKQMEEKQKKVQEHLPKLYAATGSPYALPVPFIPKTADQRPRRPKSALQIKKKEDTETPIKRSTTKENLKDRRVANDPKDDKTFYDMHYGRLPWPTMNIPENIRKEMRKKCTVEHKDYMLKKADEAKKDFKERIKEATVLYNRRSLFYELQKDFPTEKEEDAFLDIYKRYLPLEKKDVKDFSLWVKPALYKKK